MDSSWRERRRRCLMKSFNRMPIPRTRSINSLLQVRPSYISFFSFKGSLEFILWLKRTIRPSWTRIQWKSKIRLRRGSWCLVSSPFIFQVMSFYIVGWKLILQTFSFVKAHLFLSKTHHRRPGHTAIISNRWADKEFRQSRRIPVMRPSTLMVQEACCIQHFQYVCPQAKHQLYL